jgi:hypothetical protein
VAGDRLVAHEREQPVRLDGRRLALERERRDGLQVDGATNEQAGLRAEQDLARAGRLLEAGCDVDSVAGDEGLSLAPDDDPARVDPDPRFETVRHDRRAHLYSGTHRPERIVLVRSRDPEHGHDRVADELLDRPAVPLEDDAKVLEVPAHPCSQRLGVGRLTERCRADEVAEEDGDDLAMLARRLDRPERGGTRHAEARLGRVLNAAGRAGRHRRSLGGKHGRPKPTSACPGRQPSSGNGPTSSIPYCRCTLPPLLVVVDHSSSRWRSSSSAFAYAAVAIARS